MITDCKDYKVILYRLQQAKPDSVFFKAVAQLMADCLEAEESTHLVLMDMDSTIFEEEISFVMSIVSMMIFSYEVGLLYEISLKAKDDFNIRYLADTNVTFEDLLRRIQHVFKTGKTAPLMTTNIQKMHQLCQYKMREALIAKITEDLM
jgi:hypothetical protein